MSDTQHQIENSQALIEACPECGALLDVTNHDFFSVAQCGVCNSAFRVRSIMPEYSIDSLIADGALGPVLKATDLTLNQTVILKGVAQRHKFSPEIVARFEEQTERIGALGHAHILPFLSFGRHYGAYFIIAEFAEKGSLANLIYLQGQVAEAQVLEIATQVCEALNAAASIGVAHHDIKPSNIMFASATHAKVADFGVAMLLEAEAAAKGEIWGTPNYVSPEKLRCEPMDHRSDMYSLGCTLYHALGGRPPFEAEGPENVARKHLESPPVRIGLLSRNVSKPTEALVDRLLQKSPADRFQSYDEVLAELAKAKVALIESIKRRSAVVAAPKASGRVKGKSQKIRSGKVNLPFSPQPEQATTARGRASKGNPGLWVGIGAAIILVVGGIWFATKGSKPQPAAEKQVAETETPPASTSDAKLQKQSEDANQLLANRKYQEAESSFQRISVDPKATPVQRRIAVTQMGGIALLTNRLALARQRLSPEADVKFASEQRSEIIIQGAIQALGKALRDSSPTKVERMQNYNRASSDAVLALFIGLKNWNLGKFKAGAEFMKFYAEGKPPAPLAWADAYRPSIQQYLDAEKEYEALMFKMSSAALTGGSKDQFFGQLKAMREKYPIQGTFVQHLTELESQLKNGTLIDAVNLAKKAE